ncbi:putative xylose isomerase-like sugar epimerase [Burkholderia ambifaria]
MTQPAFHFSLNRMSAPRLPLDRYVALCRRLGVDSIEIRNDVDGVEITDGTPASAVRATAEAGGVTILTINGCSASSNGMPSARTKRPCSPTTPRNAARAHWCCARPTAAPTRATPTRATQIS